MLAEARRDVRGLTSRAHEEVASLRNQAYAEGYATGITAAAQALATYLAEHARLVEQIRSSVRDDVMHILQGTVNDRDVVMAAFDECLRNAPSASSSGAELVMPEAMRPMQHQLEKRLRERVDGAVNVAFEQQSRFVLRVGEYVAEFVPDVFIDVACSRIMARLPSIHAACGAAARQCSEQLKDIFSSLEDGPSSPERHSDSLLVEHQYDQSTDQGISHAGA